MTRPRVAVNIERAGAKLRVDWGDGRRTGGADFDETPGAAPRWIGSAEDLFAGADRRAEQTVVDALVGWAEAHGTTVGLYHGDGTVEELSRGT